MSLDDASPGQPEPQVPPIPAIDDDDVPARRLLAHDLEHLNWDHDGEDAAPPPD